MCGTWIFKRAALLALFVLAGLAGPAQPVAPQWTDTYVGRLQVLALLQTLNAELLASRSATLTLERWCRDHRLAAKPEVVARLMAGDTKAPTAEQLGRLQVESPGEVKYRRVELRCGDVLLSVADNWYVPGRLTAAMNRALETTAEPFGKAVRELEPTRQTVAMTILWAPLPEGWEMGAAGENNTMPDALFEHRAVLFTSERKPFSEVREIYQRGLFRFVPPVAK